MSGRRAKALRRGALSAASLQANECIPEYLGYWSREGLVRLAQPARNSALACGRWRWATIPGSWRRLLRRKRSAYQTWEAQQTRRVVTGSTPPGRAGSAAQAERVTVRKPRSVGFTSMAALMLAAFPSGESR